ncbi:EF-hand [Wolfiporia cocos MD-104 SS10]|uniref:EF-hand n=1 Tax=Wolfiporia cocos (strain MD-104) TaxID=742152 RepID=A0A2H3JHM1_WOLCO|nr:EF-hand [Wolfiporia cocos MD-104 SS10]
MSIRSVSSHGSHGSHGPHHHHHHHHHHRDSQSSYRNGSLSRDRSAAYGGAGYASAPPPGVDAQLWQTFNAVDVDHSGSISVSELRNALVNGDWTKFDLDTVKMLMNMFDTDRSGTIGFTEFSGLWNYIKQWQDIFRRFDKDRSGSIEGYELAEALRSFGYNLSPAILTIIEQKYASGTTAEYGPPPGITFDRFVRACVVVKSLTESFQRADTDRDGYIQLNYEQFMKITLSMP